jgi:hypothetical protein
VARFRFIRSLAVLGALGALLGCPVNNGVSSDGDNSNFLQDSSGGGVGHPKSFLEGGNGGGSGGGIAQPFSCGALRSGAGVSPDPTSGQNPGSLSPNGATVVAPLYFNGGDVSVSISSAKTAVVALADTQLTGTTAFNVAWSGSGLAYRTQSVPAAAGRPETGQERTERLAQEFTRRLHPTTPPARRTQAVGSFNVGDGRVFKVINFTPPQQVIQVPTTAVFVNPPGSDGHGGFVIWVDNQDAAIFQGGNSPLNAIASQLRDRIYPTDTCAFGYDTLVSDNNQQPQDHQIMLSDDYVHFVFSHLVDGSVPGSTQGGDGTLGFFTLADFTPGESAANNDKILYIAASATSRSLGDLYAVVAHEFQHCLFSMHRVKTVGFSNHLAEFNSGKTTWMNEGMSMLAMLINGNGPDGPSPSPSILAQIAEYLNGGSQSPGGPERYSMTDFYQTNGNPSDAYGMVTLFFQYLDDRLGDGIMKELHSVNNQGSMYVGGSPTPPLSATTQPTNLDPLDLVNRVLQNHGTSIAQMLPEFAAAVALDGSSALSGLSAGQAARYSISNVNLRGKYTVGGQTIQLNGPVALTPSSRAFTMKPYSIGFTAQGNLTSALSFKTNGVGGGAPLLAKLILQ